MPHDGDTICGLSSGRPPAGVGVIRVSGPAARDVHTALTGLAWTPRIFRLARLRRVDGETLDHGLVLNFEAGASFTGEDVVEFQVHGGPAVVRAVLESIRGIPRVRFAEAGEFTRRAFLNGRIDLVSAENLADLVTAETEEQRRLAIANADGRNALRYENWRKQLISIRGRIEADLDFSDEEDVAGSVADEARAEIGAFVAALEAWTAGYAHAEIIRVGFRVVLLGAPNVGKSSLLNAIARRDVALVSDEPGTTRDAIETILDVDGVKIVMTDTAGLRDDAGAVERMGIERALARARGADLVLWLADRSGSAPPVGEEVLTVATKADLGPSKFAADHCVSAVTGDGVAGLLRDIGERARRAAGPTGEMPTHLREAELLKRCLSHLRAANMPRLATEVVAEELRLASDALGHITGTVSVEDLLDHIFSQFCIGK